MPEKTLAAVARALEVRADQPGVFSGYASLFGVADNQGDRVEPGAFRTSLEAWGSRGRRPAMLWQHNPSEPIGLWTEIVEDGVGLRVEGRLLLSVRAGAEAYEHIKAGTVTGLSIGYQAVEARRDRKTGLRRLVRVNLWEISLVTFPANSDARVATVKAEEDRGRLDRALRSVASTRPIVAFLDRKNAARYQRRHGRPQPRDDIGRFGNGAGDARTDAPGAERPQARVDWTFISEREGGQRLDAEVPADPKTDVPVGQSGVTVATGFDLGNKNAEELRRLGVPQPIIDKLRPYFGLKRESAQAMLKAKPLSLSQSEADAIDALKRRDVYEKLRRRYDAAVETGIGSGATKFDELDRHARTAILSVAFQYGENLEKRTPNFWRLVTQQDWEGAVRELTRFEDDYPSRRRREADFLSRAIRGDVMR